MIRYINSVLIKGALAPFCKIGAICDDNDNDDYSKNNKTVRGQQSYEFGLEQFFYFLRTFLGLLYCSSVFWFNTFILPNPPVTLFLSLSFFLSLRCLLLISFLLFLLVFIFFLFLLCICPTIREILTQNEFGQCRNLTWPNLQPHVDI